MSYCKVIALGNLTRDPEIKYLPSGTAITSLTLAVSRQYSTKDGEKKEEQAFIECTAFGKQAEAIAKYCKKGRPLLCEGRLKSESWTDKQSGQKRSKLVVTIESFTFVGKREDAPGDNSAPAEGTTQAQPAADDADQIPF